MSLAILRIAVLASLLFAALTVGTVQTTPYSGAGVAYAQQDSGDKSGADINVDVRPEAGTATTRTTTTHWYADPLWLGVGAAGVLLVIILLFAASRGGSSGTTVIRN